MMSLRSKSAGALALVSAFVLSGCSGGNPAASGPVAAGDPQSGGEAVIATSMEPRTLDPGVLGSVLGTHSVVGNALYGQLFTLEGDEQLLEPKLAESLESENGVEWALTLREGLEFSDGSPFEADDVKFAWDRMKDPALGATDIGYATAVETTEVLSPSVLGFTLVAPNMQFGQSIASSSMNWVGKPEALQQGAAEFDANPVGAGPFTLENWVRNGDMKLVGNANYFDAPKPYLDALTIRALTDPAQRMSTLMSGGAQLAFSDSSAESAEAQASGYTLFESPSNGGNVVVFNNESAPFDDVRARRAVASAVDLEALGTILNGDHGEPVETLFTPDSPFYDESKQLDTHDSVAAQVLLDELAAEGKPLEFTILSYPTQVSKLAAESIQAQLSALDNITVNIEIQDVAALTARSVQGDFQASISGLMFADPEPALFRRFHSTSGSGNIAKVSDAELDAALSAGRACTTAEERQAAYATVQDRLADLVPVLFYTRNTSDVVTAPSIAGIDLFGPGGVELDEVWMAQGDVVEAAG